MTQLPGIYVPVSADYSALDKGLREAKTLAASRALEISNAINNALSPNKISGGFDSLVRQLSSLDRASKVAQQGFNGIKTGLEDVRKVTSLTEKEWAKLQERFLSTQVANAQEAALKRIATQLKLNKEEVRSWGAQFGLVPEQIDRVNKAVGNVAESGKKKMDIFAGSIAMAAGKFLLLEQAAYSVSRILNSTVFDFNATVETATLGISAAFLNNGQYVDNITGKVLTGQEAMKAAMADAGSVIDQLRASNLQTIATLDQLIKAYQEAAPVALKKGFNKDQVEQFTVAMMQAAGAVDTTGMLIGQMGEEMRSLLNGGINPKNTRIATALGITNEDVAKYKGDVQGLFNFIMSKLAAYQMFGEQLQSTWRGVASNTVDILKQVTAKATEPIFTGVRDGLKAVTDSIGKVEEKTDELGNKTKAITWNPEYQRGVDDLRGSFEHLVDAVTGGKQATGEFFPDLLLKSADAIDSLANVTSGLHDIYDAAKSLTGFGNLELGVIGYALFRGGPQAALIVAALEKINELLGSLTGNNIGALSGKFADATASSRAFGESVADVFNGKRDWNTGELVGVSDQARQIDNLKRTLADFEEQKKKNEQHPLFSSIFGDEDNSKIDAKIAKVKDAIKAISDVNALSEQQTNAQWQANPNSGPSEEAAEGHRKLVEMLRTEREEIKATYEEQVKYADTPELRKKLDAWRDNKLALIDEREAREKNAEAMRSERSQLQQLGASIKSYVNDARDLAKVSEEWNRAAKTNIDSMQRMNDDLLMSSMDENGRAMYEIAKKFEEAAPIFEDFQGNVERAKDSVDGLESAYKSIGEQLESARSSLSGNSVGSDTEDANKLHELESQYQSIGEALEERKAILQQLNDLEAQGVTTLDQYMEKWKEIDRFNALVDAYRELGYISEDTYDLMMEKADAWKKNFVNRTGEVALAERLYYEQSLQLRTDRASSKYLEDGSIGGLIGTGLENYKIQVDHEAIRFYSDMLPNAIDQSSDALATFFADVATGNESMADAWDDLGEALKDTVADILQELLQLQLKMAAMSMLGINSSGGSTGGGLIGLLGAGISAFFGGGSSSASTIGGAWSNEAITAGWGLHGGGIVGDDQPAFYRNVPTSIYSNAPRLHNGLLSDEYPAILQRGESVLTPKQMAAMGKSSGKAVNVSVHNFGSSKIEVQQLGPDDIRIIAREEAVSMVRKHTPGVVASSIADPNSRVAKTLVAKTTATMRRA